MRVLLRSREKIARFANAALLWMLRSLHRSSGFRTTYHVSHAGVSADFEGLRFVYCFKEYGCTGNIDFTMCAENETRQALRGVMGSSDVLYDVGAHGGVYSLTLKDLLKDIEVHSFEPLAEELIANFALNNRSIANVHQVAVGDKAGVARMTTQLRSSNHIGTQRNPGDREVPVVRLDDYVAEKGLPLPQWIKIDIEGMELPALRGAEKVLQASLPVVICEINQLLSRFGVELHQMTGYMDSLGYDFFRLTDMKLHRIALPCGSVAELGYSSDNNFWFVPRGRSLPMLAEA